MLIDYLFNLNSKLNDRYATSKYNWAILYLKNMFVVFFVILLFCIFIGLLIGFSLTVIYILGYAAQTIMEFLNIEKVIFYPVIICFCLATWISLAGAKESIHPEDTY